MNSGFMKSGTGRKKVHVSELQVGMYVSKLDRDWLETPFLMQGFTISSRQDIDTIAQYCEYVWIDALTQTYVSESERQTIEPQDKGRKRTTYVNQVSASLEHQQAFGIHRDAKRITKNLLDEARLGASINTQEAKETVNECVKSIMRNPDALMWMSKIRHEDEYTAEHCLNVCVLAIAFGRHLGMEEADLHKIGFCGLLHDVGKMKVPVEVLNKPSGLSEKEFKVMKAHTIHGRNLLMSSTRPGAYQGAVDVAYSHHERIDGSGYPRKLSAAGISQFSRIIGVVDAYDAMTTKRCYDTARPSTDALKELYRCRGTHFDAYYTEQFIEMVGLYPPGSIVELVNGQLGIVFDTNKQYRHLPKVLIVRDENKEICRESVVTLADIEQGKLDRSYLIKRVITDGTYGVTLQDYKDKGLQISFG